MDTFVDKLAQKRNAQEMILANMTAETAKMEQMQNQMLAYDELMQEIRHVNLKTAENLSDVQRTLKDYMAKLETAQADHSKTEEIKQTLEQLKGLLENTNKNEEILQALTRFRESLEEKFRLSDDFLHRENVKVYRNVQAAMTEELNRQTEELKNSQRENRGSKAVLPISITILIAVLADIAIHLFDIILPYTNM